VAGRPPFKVKVRRVVVRLDSRERAALRAAAALAAELEAELLGLFVEDPDLLSFAALPFARELCFTSATQRALDRPAMERSLRALAAELERACAAAMRGAAVPWAFRSTRGSLAAGLLAAAEESAPTLLLPPVVQANPVVICPSEAAAQDLAAVLEALARAFGEAASLLRGSPDEAMLGALLERGHPVLVLARGP
jgi:hypothetical protein